MERYNQRTSSPRQLLNRWAEQTGGFLSSQSLTNLDDLVRGCAPHPDWRLELVLPEIGGGKLTQQHLSVIETSPNSTALRISGLDQNTFEQLIERYGRFSGIYFWKCPRLVDLTPLEALS